MQSNGPGAPRTGPISTGPISTEWSMRAGEGWRRLDSPDAGTQEQPGDPGADPGEFGPTPPASPPAANQGPPVAPPPSVPAAPPVPPPSPPSTLGKQPTPAPAQPPTPPEPAVQRGTAPRQVASDEKTASRKPRRTHRAAQPGEPADAPVVLPILWHPQRLPTRPQSSRLSRPGTAPRRLPPPGVAPGGYRNHTVKAGETLWSIARAGLGAEATDAEVQAETSRLWAVNADRIASGDPDLIHTGETLLVPAG